jgi:hypothetical protein
MSRRVEDLLNQASLELDIEGALSLDTMVALDELGILFDGTDPDEFEENE